MVAVKKQKTSYFFNSATAAVDKITELYQKEINKITREFKKFACDKNKNQKINAYYPFVRIKAEKPAKIDRRTSYGFVSEPGVYETTLTRPDIFYDYYVEQLKLIIENHGVEIEVGLSNQPIPIHFAFNEGLYFEGDLKPEKICKIRECFDIPHLSYLDDSIVNGTLEHDISKVMPLALFTAPRVDYSLHRLLHYTGTSPKHFQSFVLFTNYQFYIDEFIKFGKECMQFTKDEKLRKKRCGYTAFVEPGDYVTFNHNIENKPCEGGRLIRLPQMPAYHLKREDGTGITMINIGVGPSNAKTITDHIAVLRPYAWLMLGHCAGLRNTQKLGDYVLAHGYVREDHVLDADLPTWIPIPALAEMQVALEEAAEKVTGLSGYELKSIIRTGTVATIDNRNWELRNYREPLQRFSQSRAIALDMESATIAGNGFRFRVPYGTLLCVSDKPLHGELKLPGMASRFYNIQVEQHTKIGILAMEILRKKGIYRLHSRKLRSFAEVGFR